MKTYLLRINLDIKGAKDESKSVRFMAAIESLSKLHKSQNKLVILSHKGRPKASKGKPKDFDKDLSLRPIKNLLEKKLEKKIVFFDDFDFPSIKEKIASSPKGSIFMLENLRFLDGEIKNSKTLARELASLGDEFINDDFATAHRANASNVGITKFIPARLGPIFSNEIKILTQAVKNPKHPFVFIIGGAKIGDKMGVIKNLGSKADKILLGGGPANTVLYAVGGKIGTSIYEPEMVAEGVKMAKNEKVEMPEDFESQGSKILDIGPMTVKKYSKIIKAAKLVIWGGPMGAFEKKGFAAGSFGVAEAVAKTKGFTIVGGGETTEIINRLKLNNKIDLLSTGGGAMLEFLAGKKLPALVALKRSN